MSTHRVRNQSLRTHLASADWTYEALARTVNTLGAENGMRLRYDRSSVAHWLAGAVPRPRTRALIAEAFTRRLRRPVTPHDLGFEDLVAPAAFDERAGSRGVPPAFGRVFVPAPRAAEEPDRGPADAVARLSALCAMDADQRRRTPLHSTIYRAALTTPLPDPGSPGSPGGCGGPGGHNGHRTAHPDTAHPDTGPGAGRAQAGAALPGRDTDAPTRPASGPPACPAVHPTPGPDVAPGATGLRAAVGFFDAALELGGRHARTALVAYLNDDVVPRLYDARGIDGRGALLAEAARLTLVLARMYADDAHNGVAQRYHLAALHLAAEAHDHPVYAAVLRDMSTHALGLGHRRAALRLAEAAVAGAPLGRPWTRAFLLAQVALAQAGAGHPHRATMFLDAADRLHHHAAPAGGGEPDPDPLRPHPRASHILQKGRVLAALGEHDAAVAALRSSLDHRPGTAYRARALTHAVLARLHLRGGRLDECCAAWHAFLDDYPRLSSGRVDEALGELRRNLRIHRAHRPVGVLLDRAATAAAPPARD